MDPKKVWILCSCGKKHLLKPGIDAPIYWCRNTLRILREGDEVEYKKENILSAISETISRLDIICGKLLSYTRRNPRITVIRKGGVQMEIRPATEEDLATILDLGEEFGHLMLYQKDPEIMEKYLPRILVAEEELPTGTLHEGTVHEVPPSHKVVVGYYHYIVSSDPGFEEMLRCYRQFPESLISEAKELTESFSSWYGPHCVCMQGASHREVFSEFILYLQARFNIIWCYCSMRSKRPETYKELGFTFNPDEQFSFFNIHKGDFSTYQLGRWRKQ